VPAPRVAVAAVRAMRAAPRYMSGSSIRRSARPRCRCRRFWVTARSRRPERAATGLSRRHFRSCRSYRRHRAHRVHVFDLPLAQEISIRIQHHDAAIAGTARYNRPSATRHWHRDGSKGFGIKPGRHSGDRGMRKIAVQLGVATGTVQRGNGGVGGQSGHYSIATAIPSMRRPTGKSSVEDLGPRNGDQRGTA
jgi:hypothetical protein